MSDWIRWYGKYALWQITRLPAARRWYGTEVARQWFGKDDA